jgi:hypothetical protein
VLNGLKSQNADFSLVRKGPPSEWCLITPFSPLPLHISMSLQI